MISAFRRWHLRRRLRERIPTFGPIHSIVVMCTANRVRSPFAAAYLSRRLPPSIKIISRGVLDSGARCPGESIDAASEFGIDLAKHRSTRFKPAELLVADLVLTMELRMAHELALTYPSIEHAIVPLGFFDPLSNAMQDVYDPYMLPAHEYLTAYERIARCCDALAARLDATLHDPNAT